jgi:NAD(P)H dehydrogenase (quinone)
MPKFTVTGSTGNMGGKIIRQLLDLGVEPGDIRASAREPSKARQWQQMGLDVRKGDYADPKTLLSAFADTEHLLLISGDQIGARVPLHRNAVEAAKKVGVNHIVYTSAISFQNLPAGTTQSPLEHDHRQTEEIILGAGIPYTILRNSIYAEAFLSGPVSAAANGVYVTCYEDAELSSVCSDDLARGAAIALSEPGHLNQIYEIAAPSTWRMSEALELARRLSGKPIEQHTVPVDRMKEILIGNGVPEGAVDMIIGMNMMVASSQLTLTSPDLSNLLGHPPTPIEKVMRRMLNIE